MTEPFNLMLPNDEHYDEDEIDNALECQTCMGQCGWDETVEVQDDNGVMTTVEQWVVCDDCEGRGMEQDA